MNNDTRMATFYTKVKIPRLLHPLHGESTTLFELIITYAMGIGMAIAMYLFTYSLTLSIGKRLILVLLTIDIAGGVMANFTFSTKTYYMQRSKLGRLYLPLHMVQPLVLSYVFSSDLRQIIGISLYAILSAWLVRLIKSILVQRMAALMLYTMGILFLHWLSLSIAALSVLFSWFMLKLIVGFALRSSIFDREGL